MSSSVYGGLSPKVIAAFAVVYLVWGSTYLGNIIAIETIPPFVLIASRLLVAGAVLWLYAFAKTRWSQGSSASSWTWPSVKEWRNLAITSFLFLTVGLGAVVWAEQYIDSGPTALIVALEPLAVVMVLWGFDGKRPRWQAFAGVALGIVGMVLLVGQDVVLEGEGVWYGVGAVLIGIFAWAFGSVLTARLDLPANRVLSSAYQMLLAGTFALPLAWIFGGFSEFEWAAVSARSAWAWAFLVVFGSIIAYSCFTYLLKEVSPEKVASSTYVHPVVALTLGVLIRDEVVTLQTGLACLVLLGGVLLVNVNWGRRPRGEEAQTPITQPRQANAGPVLRRWRGQARPGQHQQLADFIEQVVLPDMRASPGNLAARLVRDPSDDQLLGVDSTWINSDAEQRFVPDASRPKRYQGDEQLVEPHGQRVVHVH